MAPQRRGDAAVPTQDAAAALAAITAGPVLGAVRVVEGAQAAFALAPPGPDSAARPTVGRFVAIAGPGSLLVGMIARIAAEPGSGVAEPLATVDLLGEIAHGPDGALGFRRGVRDYPALGDRVTLLGHDALALVHGGAGARAITVGHLSLDPAIPAWVDAEHMLAKHFAVVGSTGVGKSSAVAAILTRMIGVKPELRVLLLDVHNEYRAAFGARASVVGAENLRLPFWLLNFEELVGVLYGGRPAPPEEIEILAELVPVARARHAAAPPERGLLERRQTPRHNGFTADTPSPYQLPDLVALIQERMGKLENRASGLSHQRLVGRIEAVRTDPRYEFMFRGAHAVGDVMAEVLDQAFGLTAEDRPVTVLRLASLPDEVVDAVVCVLARLAFDFALWSDGALPILIACEEAHRYAAADHGTGFAPARRALKRIAREGRKYGVHLGLVTQRPAEIDPTILSQCSTLFVMRMTSDADQALIRAAASDAAATLLGFVPSLGAQEAIGIGEGMPLVARITFATLTPDAIPQSESGARVGDAAAAEADLPRERGAVVQAAIDRWRRATTSVALRSDPAPTAAPTAAPAVAAVAQPAAAAPSLRLRL
jgi:DNA helicase HerA-like ATPase